MNSKLNIILENKAREVLALKKNPALSSQYKTMLSGEAFLPEAKSFEAALQKPGLNIIAEIKRRSPSKGDLATIPDPVILAKKYVDAGASAISVLTDTAFSGHLEDLKQVSNSIQKSYVPVLRKDFIIDPIQIAEAVSAGADAVLLIVAVVQKNLSNFLKTTASLGRAALVEVHTREELNLALDAGAKIIGINNRNLHTFEIDTRTSLELIEYIPANLIKVAESGITETKLTSEYAQAGFNAVLIGEALVKAKDPSKLIRAIRGFDE